MSNLRDGSSGYGALRTLAGAALRPGALVLALLPPAAARAETVYLVADASTDAAAPSAAAGSAPTLRVGPGGVTYLRFDVSALPAGMVVEQATLLVRPLRVLAAGSVAAHAVDAEWQEDTLAHERRPAWSEAAIALQQVTEESAGGLDVAFGVRAAVAAWVAGSPNHGLALVGDGVVDVDLASKENQSVAAPPRLEIVLVPGPAAP